LNIPDTSLSFDLGHTAAHQIAPPQLTETQPSFNKITAGLPPMADLIPLPNLTAGDMQGIFTVDQAITGLGLTGFCSPGLVAIIAPLSEVGALKDAIGLNPSASNLLFAALATQGFTKITGISNLPGSAGWFMLRPGETVSFGRVVSGFCGIFCTPWSGAPPDPNFASVVYPDVYQGQTGVIYGGGFTSPGPFLSNRGVWGPATRPYLRTFLENESVPGILNYTKTPYVVSGSNLSVAIPSAGGNATTAPGPGVDIPLGLIPPGTGYVTVAAAWCTNGLGTPYDNSAIVPLKALRGGAVVVDFDIDIYWLLADGIWHTNPADNWRSSGRGRAGASHDVEVYTIPHNASAISVNASDPTGTISDLFWPTCIMTEA
jgi:hypothetical protein